VDADYAEMSPGILSTVRSLAPDADPPIRYLVNTHWHFDHTSGNENLAEAGATIVAHENVLRLLSEDQVMAALSGRVVPAASERARPTITFDDRMNLSLDGEILHLIHMPNAHTDGDIIVHFPNADVVHMGDIFFNGMYPFIDVDHGGNIVGMVRAIDQVLEHTGETTLFIPGHGPLAERSELQAYGEMLRTVQDRVQTLIGGGASREEVIAAKPTFDLDPVWAGESGFLQPDVWVGLVYDGMVRSFAPGTSPE